MSISSKKVCVVGLGYIGLPTAAVLARTGFEVVGLDVNKTAIDTINSGRAHIVEVDLDGLLQGVVSSGKLRATDIPEEADIFVIAVPTPFKQDHKPDLSYIQQSIESIAPVMRPGNLVILESTVPPGATNQMVEWILDARPDLKEAGGVGEAFFAAHCPERVLPGRVLIELVSNDRIVGGITQKCSDAAVTLYESFVQGECFTTNARTAELAKLTENAFRDVNIAFANELSLICDQLDINVWELIKLSNRHPRVNILQPGPGVGGHCIAVDPWFIVDATPDQARLIKTARQINDSKPDFVLRRVKDAAAKLKAPKIACLGLAFKADVDDLRTSPALSITKQLAMDTDHPILAVEPYIDVIDPELGGLGVELVSLDVALKTADILVLLVDHRPFKKIDSARLMDKIVFDTRGIW